MQGPGRTLKKNCYLFQIIVNIEWMITAIPVKYASTFGQDYFAPSSFFSLHAIQDARVAITKSQTSSLRGCVKNVMAFINSWNSFSVFLAGFEACRRLTQFVVQV